ncbi:hypothetical protein V6L77_25045 [Pannonibacter sp. Pt2-lr]
MLRFGCLYFVEIAPSVHSAPEGTAQPIGLAPHFSFISLISNNFLIFINDFTLTAFRFAVILPYPEGTEPQALRIEK